jgi:hypothetical protein
VVVIPLSLTADCGVGLSTMEWDVTCDSINPTFDENFIRSYGLM